MNKNQLATDPVQNSNFDFKNPLIAVTAILTVGVCYCTTVIVNAKYNRDVELKYKDFSLNIQPSVSVVAV
ncbi:MAG: hypothetical protein NC347_03910 [Clostridium sp.]|nr:hypothetical protein [Clostridium sp.]